MLAGGKRNRYEDDTPKHVENIVLLTITGQNSGITTTKAVFDVPNNSSTTIIVALLPPHNRELKSTKR